MSTTLYVQNLPLSATEETLAEKFGRFGAVLSVKIPRDAATGRHLRRGYVEMLTVAQAENAIRSLNLAEYDGRLLAVYKALVAVPIAS